jgi:hypothetical protein
VRRCGRFKTNGKFIPVKSHNLTRLPSFRRPIKSVKARVAGVESEERRSGRKSHEVVAVRGSL